MIDPVPTAINVAAALVRSRLSHSKQAYRPPPPKNIVGYGAIGIGVETRSLRNRTSGRGTTQGYRMAVAATNHAYTPVLGERLHDVFGRDRLWLLVLPMTLFFVVFFVFPVLSLFALSLDKPMAGVVAVQGDFVLDQFHPLLHLPQPITIRPSDRGIGVVVALIAAILGYPLAYLIAKTEHPPWNTLLMILVLTSMQLDGVIRIYGMMVLLGDNGLINGTPESGGIDRQAAAPHVQCAWA